MRTYFFLAVFFLSAPAKAQTPSDPFDFRVLTHRPKHISFTGESPDSNIPARDVHILKDDRAIDSAYGLGKNYDFEFRLWERHLISNYNNVFVLTLKNNQWTARYFAYNTNRPNRIGFWERPVDQSKVNQLWELLVQNNVLTLPSQEVLLDMMVSYRIDTANLGQEHAQKNVIIDGPAYIFELLTPAKKRFYSYGSPHTYFKDYINIKELYNAVVIIMLVQKFLGQPLQVY